MPVWKKQGKIDRLVAVRLATALLNAGYVDGCTTIRVKVDLLFADLSGDTAEIEVLIHTEHENQPYRNFPSGYDGLIWEHVPQTCGGGDPI